MVEPCARLYDLDIGVAVYVPLLQPIFKTEALTAGELAFTLAMSTIVFIAVEIEKVFKRRGRKA